jgi:type II secretory pathway predicted ATPase ExeA
MIESNQFTQLNQYFGFSKTPFCKEIDEKHLHISEEVKKINSVLQFAVKKTDVSLIFARAGAGKSTAVRYFISGLDDNHYRVFYMTTPKTSIRELYRYMVQLMNMKPAWLQSENKLLIHNLITQQAEEKQIKFIFIIDEAHTLTVESLDGLRLLLNFKMDSRSYLHFIFISEPSILQTLNLESMAPLKQRITFKFGLLGLERTEIKDYVEAHLKYAGVQKMLFTDEALESLFQYSKGLPREINMLAQYSLLIAMSQQKNLVDQKVFQEAVLHLGDSLHSF